jgi:hypothetical protein
MGYMPAFLWLIFLLGFISLGILHIFGCISFLGRTKPPFERTNGSTIVAPCVFVLSMAIAVALDWLIIIAR